MRNIHLFNFDTDEYYITVSSKQFNSLLCDYEAYWPLRFNEYLEYPSKPRASFGYFITREDWEDIKLKLIKADLEKEVIRG